MVRDRTRRPKANPARSASARGRSQKRCQMSKRQGKYCLLMGGAYVSSRQKHPFFAPVPKVAFGERFRVP
ncbi:protein of unknown function [Aminobacter niigataensis]|nr:protein of unknown function [Aminobacter niigataensis]